MRTLLLLLTLVVAFSSPSVAHQYDYAAGVDDVYINHYWLESPTNTAVKARLRSRPVFGEAYYFALEAADPILSNCEIINQSGVALGADATLRAPSTGSVTLSLLVRKRSDDTALATYPIVLHAFASEADFPALEFDQVVFLNKSSATSVSVAFALHNAVTDGSATASFLEHRGVLSGATITSYSSTPNAGINGEDVTFNLTPNAFGAHSIGFPVELGDGSKLTIYERIIFNPIVRRAKPHPNSVEASVTTDVFVSLADFVLASSPTLLVTAGSATVTVTGFTADSVSADITATAYPVGIDIVRADGEVASFEIEEESAEVKALRDLIALKLAGKFEVVDGDCCLKLIDPAAFPINTIMSAIRAAAELAGEEVVSGQFEEAGGSPKRRYLVRLGGNASAHTGADASPNSVPAPDAANGVAGTNGTNGTNGENGINGTTQSPNGGKGTKGGDGTNGSNGKDAKEDLSADGSSGDDGDDATEYDETDVLTVVGEEDDCDRIFIVIAGDGGQGGKGAKGQTGGRGGQGGSGGNGGNGGKGGKGGNAYAEGGVWFGAGGHGGAAGVAGNGGNAGNGGQGGDGGSGGDGGWGGDGQAVDIKADRGFFLVSLGNGGDGGDGADTGLGGDAGPAGIAGGHGTVTGAGKGGDGAPKGSPGTSANNSGNNGNSGLPGTRGANGTNVGKGAEGGSPSELKQPKVTKCFHLVKSTAVTGSTGANGKHTTGP